MRLVVLMMTLAAVAPRLTAQTPPAFTLQQVLSAPYSTNLTPAPAGARFAWVEHSEGRNNLWVAAPAETARQLTHNTQDDAQDITQLAWSPDGSAIAYTYGAEPGVNGKPANPAHLQQDPALHVRLQPLAADAPMQDLGEGRAAKFLRGGCGVLYLKAGKIWARGLKDEPHPGSMARSDPPGFGFTNGVLDLPECDKSSGAYQLVYDRGTARSMELSPDGNMLAYISRRGSHSFLALYDLRALVLTFPSPSTGNDSAPVFSRDGKYVAWLRFPFTGAREFALNRVSANPWSIQVLELATGKTHTVFQPEPSKPGSAEPRLSTGEPHLYFTADDRVLFFSEADGWVHLYSVGAEGGKPVLLTPGDGEVEDVSLSADGRRVYWSSNVRQGMVLYDGLAACFGPTMSQQPADTERRHLWSLDLTKSPSAKANLFDESGRMTLGEGIETHPVPLSDGSVVALASDSFVPMHPVFVQTHGEMNAVREDWLPKPYPRHDLVFPEDVTIPSGKLTIHGQLFVPGATKIGEKEWAPSCNGHRNSPPAKNPVKRPAILFFHGGPMRQMLLGFPGMDYYSNAYAFDQYLVSRGFVVLSVNYRGGIGYGLEFRQCEHCGADGAAEYEDVLAAVRYLRGRPDVDPKRIGLWGGSYGGYLTALGLARNSDLFAAGVDFHGVHDWNLEDNAGDWKQGSFAEQDAIAARARASSPIGAIDGWRSPVLLIHGDDDPEVAYTQTPMLADALRARHVPVEELIFPDEVHGFLLHRDWIAAYTAAAAFFERTLKP